jgi:TRAP-type mannitol/chloroaromatic compound transport system permease large subunit
LKPVLKPGSKYLKGIVSEKDRKDVPMKKQVALFTYHAQKINRQHIQLVLTLIALSMLVLGVGAPTEGGGVGPR